MNNSLSFWILLTLFFLTACVPPTEEILTDVNIDFKNDKLLQRIYTFQDQQAVDSLVPFFENEDPTYRYAAAMAFASIKDATALERLYLLLADEIEEVRIAAAYAIGQIGNPSAEQALISAYNSEDSTLQDQKYNATVLEAVGKCGSLPFLKSLSTIKSFTRSDTLLLEGQAWGIYRYALREMVLPSGTKRMAEVLTKKGYPNSVRLIAANYLARAKKIKVDSFARPLAKLLFTENDPNIRMALVLGLGKSQTQTAADTLIQWYPKESDYRVKCNLIRALANFDYKKIQPLVLAALDDPNHQIANTAAQFLVNFGNSRDASYYWRKAKHIDNWELQTLLYKAALKHMPSSYANYKEAINWELIKIFKNSSNSYQKAGILDALTGYYWNYKNIHKFGYASDDLIVRTAGVQALATLATSSDFDQKFRGSAPRVKRELIDFFIEAINKNDAAMVAVAASALRTPQLGFKETIEDIGFLENALSQLTMPKEIETYIELSKTISFYKTGEVAKIPPPKYNHPIEWRRVKAIEANTKAIIETNKGTFELSFLTDLAPATVTNFIQLAREGFYKGKYIHRVVPNFVAQTGCPRGDGYGGLNYSIRSELPPFHYDKEGYVGMASAGNHTEGTQWFITYSPTPHLDGNYTVFAKVSRGMDIVHQFQKGDIITNVTIKN